jgi:hypothetical protein
LHRDVRCRSKNLHLGKAAGMSGHYDRVTGLYGLPFANGVVEPSLDHRQGSVRSEDRYGRNAQAGIIGQAQGLPLSPWPDLPTLDDESGLRRDRERVLERRTEWHAQG